MTFELTATEDQNQMEIEIETEGDKEETHSVSYLLLPSSARTAP